jgi:multidrug resistance efflux pump
MIVAMVSLVEVCAFSGTYLFHSRHYVSVGNAQVDGDKIEINAPSAGILINWSISQGATVRENQIVGRIQGLGSGARPKRPIKSPGEGTIAVNNAVDGQYVGAGTKLATAYDTEMIYVTARVDEGDIRDVHLGKQVDISVDAFPGVPVVGLVTQIQQSSAGKFSIFPASGTDPTNPQKVDQYIPVKIGLINTNGATLVPGMNVALDIHKA